MSAVSEASTSDTIYHRIQTKKGDIFEATFRVKYKTGEERTLTYQGSVGDDEKSVIKTIEVMRQMAVQSTPQHLGKFFHKGKMVIKLFSPESSPNLHGVLWLNPHAKASANAADQWLVIAAQNSTGLQAPIARPFKTAIFNTWDENQFLITTEHGPFARFLRMVAPPSMNQLGPIASAIPLKSKKQWVEEEVERAKNSFKEPDHEATYKTAKERILRGKVEMELRPFTNEEEART